MVPLKLKITKIIPVYKSGDKNFSINYRPMPLLPKFSKILEKLRTCENFYRKVYYNNLYISMVSDQTEIQQMLYTIYLIILQKTLIRE